MISVRPARLTDLSDFKLILGTIELFPPEFLDDMIAPYLADADAGPRWYAAEQDGAVTGLAYCAPMELAEGTYNLYAIGVRADRQGQGTGGQIMRYVEEELRAAGHRLLIVDTSGTDDFKLTRRFYEKLGYEREAVIRDFWADGDDKVTFRKRLKS